MTNQCLKHGPHAPGECPKCDELAEARIIVSTVKITPADFEEWWATNPEPWNDAKTLAQLAWNAARGLPVEPPMSREKRIAQLQREIDEHLVEDNLPDEPTAPALCKHGRGPACPHCQAESANSTT